ncbi:MULTISPECIES: acyltransferase family protein [unclassified Aureimonas]|uniref:acyltransferase family protein n=1 Tax=unclassified Aureimonas TaxID=2615206 RepID=UPI000A8013C8|nr:MULTISPECIES: acyltransferase [unclassified Aureimonas]
MEIGRGVAACLVVFHHAGSIMEQPRFYDAVPFGGHLAYFYAGVDFFFVLSGFIIAWVHWGDIGEKAKLGHYAVKRFLRIYPPYWGVLIPLSVLYFAIPSGGIPSQRDPVNIVMSFLLLPYPEPPVLGVAWTLVHEIFFYLVFALVILIGRAGLWLMPLWTAAILAASFGGPYPHLVGFVLSPFNLEFIMGVGAAILLRNRTIPMPGIVASAGIASFTLLLLLPELNPTAVLPQRILFGLSATLFVLGMVEIEWNRPLKLASALTFFGAASYAIYLVHPVIISISLQVLNRVFGRSLPIELAVAATALAGILAGMVYHVVAEKPLTSLARRGLEGLGLSERRIP